MQHLTVLPTMLPTMLPTIPCSRIISLGLVLSLVAATGCAEIAGLEPPSDGRTADTMSASVPPTGRCGAAHIEADVGVLDFGEVRVNGTAPGIAAVSLRNVGDASVTLLPVVTGGAGTFAVTSGEIAFGPRETRIVQLTFTPAGLGRHEARLAFATKGGTCEALPSIALAGAGSDSAVLVQPGMVDFGSVDCGARAPAKAVVLKSEAPNAVAFTASVAGSFFSVDTPAGALAPGAVATLLVTPGVAPMEPGPPVVETLNLALPAARTVKLQIQPRGVVLAITPTELTVDRRGPKRATVKNLGNRAGSISIRSPSSKVLFTGASFTLDPGASASFDVTYLWGDDDAATITPIVEVTGAVLCRRDPFVVKAMD